MTTPGATEAVTPEQLDELRALIEMLDRSREMSLSGKKLSLRFGSVAEASRAFRALMKLPTFSLLPKEEGK